MYTNRGKLKNMSRALIANEPRMKSDDVDVQRTKRILHTNQRISLKKKVLRY